MPLDHPRSRGVYKRGVNSPTGGLGSSPLARGLLLPDEVGDLGAGIIPARAGFTPNLVFAISLAKDHPRSRGVYKPTDPSEAFSNGSSPLARGLRHTFTGPRARRGIIPARAGFTFNWQGMPDTVEDHPRSRGVYHVGRSIVHEHRRIIPARAGFTRLRNTR